MSEVSDSILSSVKMLNNVAAENTSFDDNFVAYINTALANLHQLGIGPSEEYSIVDAGDLWDDFMDEGRLRDRAKTYVGLVVNLMFDPPATSFAIDMKKQQIEEHEYRLTVALSDQMAEESA